MGIPLRTEEELVKLREACKLASDVLVMIEPYVKEGGDDGRIGSYLSRLYGECTKSDSCLLKLSWFPESNLYF